MTRAFTDAGQVGRSANIVLNGVLRDTVVRNTKRSRKGSELTVIRQQCGRMLVDEKATPNQCCGAADGNLGISPILYAPWDCRRQQGLRIHV
jgi:hypothetical protein